MEYWLKHIDKQRAAAAAQKRNLYRPSTVGALADLLPVPTLPDLLTDPREATAAWIHEHRKIWTQMSRARAAARTQTLSHHQHNHPWLAAIASSHILRQSNEPVAGGFIDQLLMASSSSAAIVRNKFASQHSSPRLLQRIGIGIGGGGGGGASSSSPNQACPTPLLQPSSATAPLLNLPQQTFSKDVTVTLVPDTTSRARSGASDLFRRIMVNPFKKISNNGESKFSTRFIFISM